MAGPLPTVFLQEKVKDQRNFCFYRIWYGRYQFLWRRVADWACKMTPLPSQETILFPAHWGVTSPADQDTLGYEAIFIS